MITDSIAPIILGMIIGVFFISNPYNIQMNAPIAVIKYVVAETSLALLFLNIFIAWGSAPKPKKIPEIVAKIESMVIVNLLYHKQK